MYLSIVLGLNIIKYVFEQFTSISISDHSHENYCKITIKILTLFYKDFEGDYDLVIDIPGRAPTISTRINLIYFQQSVG